jgi:hypothetical protein
VCAVSVIRVVNLNKAIFKTSIVTRGDLSQTIDTGRLIAAPSPALARSSITSRRLRTDLVIEGNPTSERVLLADYELYRWVRWCFVGIIQGSQAAITACQLRRMNVCKFGAVQIG